MNEPSASSGLDASSRGLHLDSWKEIAAYLKRDIRTVQRWEKREGLPVHRHQHDERGTAYAYSAEIDRWLDARSQRAEGDGVEATRTAPVTESTADANPPGVAITGDERPDPAVADRGRRVLPLLSAVAAIAILVAIVAIWRWPSDQPARPLSTLAMVFPTHERFPEWGPDMTLSPDGKTLVYSPRGGFRLRRLDELEGRGIPGTEGAWGAFFSPDGREIGFFRNGKLMRMPVDNGAPAVITDLDANFMGSADWGRHGRIVFGSPTPEGSHGLYQVPSAGGRPQLIASLEGDPEFTYWLTPQWIGDGDAVLCTVARTSSNGPRFQVVTVPVATGEPRILIDDARHARDIGGMLVYWRNDSLFAARFDSRRLEVIGPHVPAWENVGGRVRNRSWAQAGDTLVYWPKLRTARHLVWVDRDGRQEPLRLPPGMYRSPRLSPDQRRIAVTVEGDASEFGDIWVHDLEGGANLQLTHGNRSVTALWTADGSRLVVSMREGSSIDLFRVRTDGVGGLEKLLSSSDLLAANFTDPIGWAAGGELILQQSWSRSPSKFWAVPLGETRARRPIVADGDAISGSMSADGRWFAFVSTETGRAEVYVAPLPEGRPRWRVSTEGGRFPLWARSGRELFYRHGTRMMAVPVSIDGTFVPGEPRQLLDIDVYEVDPGEPHFDVSTDGRFVIVRRGDAEGPERLDVIQGWRTEIERRLREAR